MNNGELLELKCTASFPINWITIDDATGEILTNLEVAHHANDTTHQAVFTINEVSVYDVKFYYCIKEQALTLVETVEDIENEYRNFRASQIYLFVVGKNYDTSHEGRMTRKKS